MIRPIPQEAKPDSDDAHLPSLIENIFAENGHLATSLKLEHRPEQTAMARAVGQHFAQNAPLLIEAGTGVGKSLAYLIPGILYAIARQRPFIVSTHTISLQEQIQKNDLRLCRSLFKQIDELAPYASFKHALVVGRRNYLCPPRLMRAIQTKTDLFGSDKNDELERILQWSEQTKTGLVEELTPPPSYEVWDWVNAESSLSNSNTPECFYQQAKARIRQANIIIVNHSLLFSLIHAGAGPANNTPGILFPGDFAVLDEAHRLPSIATDHFGANASSAGLDKVLKMLYHPKRKKGILGSKGNQQAKLAVAKATDAAEHFFNTIRREYLAKQDTARLHQPNWTEPLLDIPLRELIEELGSLANRSQSDRTRDELLDQRRKILSYHNTITACIQLAEDDQVYWLERGGRKGQNTHLRSAPLDVANDLNQHLFSRKTSAILTSATMATGENMENFKERTGAWGQTDCILASPFDYENNMRIAIADDAPLPSAEAGRLNTAYLIDYIRFCVQRVTGGTLVLFTSYYDLRQVSDALTQEFEDDGRSVYTQGADLPRTQMTHAFAQAGNAVLLGTDSFWTGVDIPGSALSQVILTRLPFEPPTHPITQARSERLEAQGIHPFPALTIPDAIIKFRQGIGRLIRKQNDRGIITILDSRILTKEYGRKFIQALPHQNYIRINRKTRENTFPSDI